VKVALDGDVFVLSPHMCRMFSCQHFLAVNALDAIFFMDLSDMFLLVFVGKKEGGAFSVDVALNLLSFVVFADVVRNVRYHFSAVRTPFPRIVFMDSLFVLFFLSLVVEESDAILGVVALKNSLGFVM